jgi:hypothetical protein
VQTQQPQQQGAPEQTAPTLNKDEPPNKSTQHSHPNSSEHPFHLLYQQATAHVAKEDERLGRKPDEKSEHLTMSATALAAGNGIRSMDHLLFSVENKERGVKAGENMIVVQGGLYDPAHERAHMKTEVAINTPVEQSLKQLNVVHQQQTQEAQKLAQQRAPEPSQDAITPKGLKLA